MTRTLPKRTTRRVKRNALFPDAAELLRRAEDVRTVPIRHCEICGTDGAELVERRTFDGWVCLDLNGCGRRENRARRVR